MISGHLFEDLMIIGTLAMMAPIIIVAIEGILRMCHKYITDGDRCGNFRTVTLMNLVLGYHRIEGREDGSVRKGEGYITDSGKAIFYLALASATPFYALACWKLFSIVLLVYALLRLSRCAVRMYKNGHTDG